MSTINVVCVKLFSMSLLVLPHPRCMAPSPARTGDSFGSNRVLATTQIARTVTFR